MIVIWTKTIFSTKTAEPKVFAVTCTALAKALDECASIIVNWDDSLTAYENHKTAARALKEQEKYYGTLSGSNVQYGDGKLKFTVG